MNAQELRIGNYVRYGWEEFVIGRIAGVYDRAYIEFHGCEALNERNHIRNTESDFDEYLKPIPLTEEWLVKFGFEDKHGYEYPSYRKNLLLVYGRPDKEWCFIIGKGLSSFESDARPLYVHQLQNLYFALTGEELTIKE